MMSEDLRDYPQYHSWAGGPGVLGGKKAEQAMKCKPVKVSASLQNGLLLPDSERQVSISSPTLSMVMGLLET